MRHKILHIILLYFLVNTSLSQATFNREHALLHIKEQTDNPILQDSLLREMEMKFNQKQQNINYSLPPITVVSTKKSNRDAAFDCENGNWGFENGNASNWTTTGYTQVVSSGTDPYGNFPWVCPTGGNYSIKISGDQNAQANGSVSRSINVPALGTTYFSFHFAMSIFNYPHQAFEASKFHVEFFDQNGNQIPCPYFECYYSSDQGPQGVNNFQSTPNSASSYNPSANGDSPGSYGVTYTPWNDITLDLSGYAGQTITVRFKIDWCIYGPDWSYALVDVDCPTNNAEPIDRCEDLPYEICAPANMGSYTWYNDNNPNLGTNQCYTVTEAGTYYCDVLPSNVACSAGSIVTYQFDIKEKPKALFDIEDHCNGDVLPLSNNSICPTQNTCTYKWDFGDNSTINTQNSPEYTYALPGDYDIKLIVETNQGCTSELTKTVTVLEEPIAQFTVDDECVYDELQFNNTSIVSSPTVVSGWIWNFGDGSSFSSDESPSHLYNSEGTYDISLIVTLNNGCIDDTTISAKVYPKPDANFTNTTVCENQPPTEFTNTSSISSGSINAFLWDFDDGNTSNIVNPRNFYASYGIYNVTLTVTSDFGCTDSETKPVTVLEKPTVDFTSNIREGCSPVCVSFQDLSQNNTATNISWEWSFENHQVSNMQNPYACFVNSSNTIDSTYFAKVIVTNDLGCKDTLLKEDFITVYHNPIADFEPNPTHINMYIAEISFQNNSIGSDFYAWDLGDNTTNDEFEFSHVYPDTGNYEIQLIVSTIHNCTDTTYRTIRIDPVTNFYAPNTFTPNGDGINDVFNIQGYNLEEMKLEIFDRWGTLIFFSNDLNRGWDGTYKGEPAIQDTYIWKVTVRDGFGEWKKYKGHINLMR